ncbi:quinol:cytochrome C oxidoreductase [Carboxylicivirga sp. M1479]|uniref:quinol:cytochrome C oxidoreductase n=1 Tax=Carboxylicivirga sp. M1479 TaxID=2594476 RepID=UPI001178AD84|nr:quinol:cytochrome C oxidoreductase [Carboxylicivirga sp. M1479]TRX71062.1 quinol:cytochrome C oxidoreductase [Carboxylicivirga sp. M1479]
MYKSFEFTKKIKSYLLAMIVIGAVLAVAGIAMNLDHTHRIWANVLLNGFYFTAIAMSAAFFVIVHVLGESGWHTAVQRIPEAMSLYVPIGGVFMLLVLAGMHDIYHWSHTEHLDEILQGKSAYLNPMFFSIRTVAYILLWSVLVLWFRKLSLKSDSNYDLKLFNKQRGVAGVFIVLFAITSSTSAWDWIMSIDAHWFSTLFGWYIFVSTFVSAVAIVIILLFVLKSMGYMEHVNDEHLHDLGKYLFGFSIFWAYLWVSQYLLIWYSNIPEETIYYVQRIEDFGFLFYANVVINFLAPFLILMARGTKRKLNWLIAAAVIVFLGHWLDMYMAIMPGSIKHPEFGILEIGMTVFVLGVFLYAFFRNFAKAPVVPENHPYFKESFDYDNIR